MNSIKYNDTYYFPSFLFNMCSNLTYIDISSMTATEKPNIIFDENCEFPLKGKIILRLELYSLIKEKIPKGWSIIFAN